MTICASDVCRIVFHVLRKWFLKSICIPMVIVMIKSILSCKWCCSLDLAFLFVFTVLTSSIWQFLLTPSKTTFNCIWNLCFRLQICPSFRCATARIFIAISQICCSVFFPDLTATQYKLICVIELTTDCKCTFQLWTVCHRKEFGSNLFWILEKRRFCGWINNIIWTRSIPSEVARHYFSKSKY